MYATYPVLVPNAAIKPLVVDTHKNLWVFADKSHPPSPWLLLFRESTNDDDFETLTDHSLLFGYQHQTETLLQQLYRHFRIGQSDTLPSPGHTTETDTVIKNLFTGQLRMFKVDPKYKHSLLDNQSLFWTQPQNLSDGQGEDSLQLRHNIINELGVTLMARWMRTDAGNTTFEDYGFWGKRAIEYIALIHGVSDGISSVAQGLWDMIKAFAHAIKVSIEWQGKALIASYQFIESQIREGDIHLIAEKSQKLLGETISSVKQLGKRIAEGFEIFKAALTDPYVGDAFMQYMDGYTESASHVDRIYATGKIAGQVITEIVLLLALAPVQLAKLASQGVMMVGLISLKVIEILARFGRLTLAKAKKGTDFIAGKVKGVPELRVKQTYRAREDLNPLVGDTVHKRHHPDGKQPDPANGDPYGDPYTLQADGKPMGAKEGVMPAKSMGLEKLDPEHQRLIDEEGYPNINTKNEDYRNFSDIKKADLKQGDKIYRVIDEEANPSGSYWTRELPKSKTEWRDGYAVKDGWNDNGYYVEHTVGKDEVIKAWEGTTAGQNYEMVNGKRFYLEGGEQQIYIERDVVKNLQPKTTDWSDTGL